MPSRAQTLPELPPSIPPLPVWARAPGSVASREGTEDAALLAGAALAAIDPIARSDHAIGKLWRQRLALTCAEAVVRMQGRREDAAALRDHLFLTRKGDDPGPAGKTLAAWRLLGSTSSARSKSWLSDIAGLLSIAIDEPLEDAIHERMDRAAGEAAGQGVLSPRPQMLLWRS